MTRFTDIGSLITATPGIRGGRPRIAGAGVSVRTVAVCYQSGLSPEEIAHQYEGLSLAEVYAALAFYHANRPLIDADLEREEAEYDRLAAIFGRGRSRQAAPMTSVDRITADADLCQGQPTIRGMRITVSTILRILAAGKSVEELLAAYPELEADDVRQALAYAAWAASDRLPTGRPESTGRP